MSKYQICERCVMDTSDVKITFNDSGVCDHCQDYLENVLPGWQYGDKDPTELANIVARIKQDGENRDFDCILGMSGGLDSSYLAHLAVSKLGLRPLIFHVDGGWNTDTAVSNIEKICTKLNVDLYTEVINWREMKDLQLAFFKSGVPHLDIPQDHAFVATLYKFAAKHKIKYILNGGNVSTECVRNPMDWIYYGTDMRQFWDIHKRFGQEKLKSYPTSTLWRHKVVLPYVLGVKVVKLLNLMKYEKKEAIDTLHKTYGWEYYGQKHFESRFTKFYEGYWLPERFGFDTRKVQYSSLILTGQMGRDEAVQMLQEPAYPLKEASDDMRYVADKLEITVDELNSYFIMEKKTYSDYANYSNIIDAGAKILRMLGVERSIKR